MQKTSFTNALSPIILLQYLVYVKEAVENFAYHLGLGNNTFVPIILQYANTDEKNVRRPSRPLR